MRDSNGLKWSHCRIKKKNPHRASCRTNFLLPNDQKSNVFNVSLQSDHEWHLKVCVAIARHCQIAGQNCGNCGTFRQFPGNCRQLEITGNCGNNPSQAVLRFFRESTLTLQPETRKKREEDAVGRTFCTRQTRKPINFDGGSVSAISPLT